MIEDFLCKDCKLFKAGQCVRGLRVPKTRCKLFTPKGSS